MTCTHTHDPLPTTISQTRAKIFIRWQDFNVRIGFQLVKVFSLLL